MYYHSTGTITTLKVGATAVADFSQNLQGRTITNAVEIHARAGWRDPMNTVTLSAGMKTYRCTPNDLSPFDVKPDLTWTPS